jgi:flagellar motor protein MotB
MALSVRRALSVFKFFKDMGVKESKMKYEGFGETRPVAPNDTEEGRAKNRRVEIFLKERK